MSSNFILKSNKQIKINIQENFSNNNFLNKTLSVTGPLGEVKYVLKNQLKNSPIFIEGKNLNFLLEKIKKLIKSVTTGWFIELN